MTLDEFLPLVMPDLPGCPKPTVQSKAGEVLFEFCQRTRCWIEPLDPVTLRAGRDTYEIDPIPGADVDSFESMTCEGLPVDPTSVRRMSRESPNWQLQQGSRPRGYMKLAGPEFRVWPTPSVDGAVLWIEGVLMPRLPLTTLPDQVMSHNRLAIVAGVKGQLMSMSGPGVTWSNPGMAAFHLGRYEEGVFNAIVRREHGGGNESLTVRPRSFGLTG